MTKRCTLLTSLILFLLSVNSTMAGILVVGSLTRETTLEPGARTEGTIALQNADGAPAEAKVYQTDFRGAVDDSASYDEPGKAVRSNATWITFTPHNAVVPAHGKAEIYFAVQVPADAKLAGTYWSMLMVEEVVAAAPAPTAEEGKLKMGISSVFRYGIQMITNVGSTGKRDLRFADRQLIADQGKRVLQLDVENSGERGLTPTVWAEIYDDKGASLGRYSAGKHRLYPGAAKRYVIDLTKLPSGVYKALIVADNGDDTVFGTQCKLDIR